MASIVRQANGHRLIQFIDRLGARRTIRLGVVSQRVADRVKLYVESLVLAARNGEEPDGDVRRWVNSLDSSLVDKLANVGLVAERTDVLLQPFLDGYIKSRSDTKPTTHEVYRHTRRCLIAHFGPNTTLREITPGHADEWRLFLKKQNLADNTVRRRCGVAKQFFHAAVRKNIIERNPFADLKVAVRSNPSRMYFITRDEAQQVLDACPDAEWRLIFALSRFGGLRCPSEHLALQWADVDWERGRILVHSPKTEHHPGGESRMVPLFPELLAPLREVFEAARPGTKRVINRYRLRNVNLRTHLLRIIRQAGLKPWPKLFQNLRSTRETELAEQYPLHVVCAWIGNTQPVAMRHYLQVTDTHFAHAAAGRPTLAHDRAAQAEVSLTAASPVNAEAASV